MQIICPPGCYKLQSGVLAGKAGVTSRVFPSPFELLRGKDVALGVPSGLGGPMFESKFRILVSDPQALKLMARLSQAMGPSLLPLLHIHLPMTQEKQISG